MNIQAQKQYQLALELLKSGKFEEALQEVNKALEILPDQADFLSERGVIYFHLRKLDLALIDLNRAQELQPQNPYRYSSRAFLKDHIGDIQGAISDYQKAIELDPEDAIAYNNLGLLEEKLGYQERAKQNFKKADELDQKSTSEKSGEEFILLQSENKKINAVENIEQKPSKGKLMLEVFSSRKNFAEFIGFIFRGFKLKK